MATFLRRIRGPTTDLIGKLLLRMHPFIFTVLFSPTHFHPPVFTHLSSHKKWVKSEKLHYERIQMSFFTHFFFQWAKMALSPIMGENASLTPPSG